MLLCHTQRVQRMPLDPARPVWVDDPQFLLKHTGCDTTQFPHPAAQFPHPAAQFPRPAASFPRPAAQTGGAVRASGGAAPAPGGDEQLRRRGVKARRSGFRARDADDPSAPTSTVSAGQLGMQTVTTSISGSQHAHHLLG